MLFVWVGLKPHYVRLKSPTKETEFSLSQNPWLAWILFVLGGLKFPYVRLKSSDVKRKKLKPLCLKSLGWPLFGGGPAISLREIEISKHQAKEAESSLSEKPWLA